uniref:Leucine rich immune protein (Coil-less) n=1 Tax=Anopheles maculatus TaxID=74869 RepID=A0A182T4L7_9DIPT
MELYEGWIQRIEPGAFEKLSKLIKLSVQEQNITLLEDYTFRGLEALVHLDLEVSKLRSIAPHAFDGLKSLERLHLSENSLTHLPDEIFDNIGSLYALDVSYNRLKSFIYPNLKAEKLTLHYNSLTRLHINDHMRFVLANDNRIRTITGTGRHVTELRLNDNAISDVTAIARMTNLTKLCLSNNPLQPDSVFASLTNLQALLLSNTSIEISESTFANLSSMILLDLSFNKLTRLNFRMLSSMNDLETLIVAHNRIQMINFIELREYLPELQILEICDNGWNETYMEHMLLQMKQHRLWRYREKIPKIQLFREYFNDLCVLILYGDFGKDSDYSINYDLVTQGNESEALYPTSSPSLAHEDSGTDKSTDTPTTPPENNSDLEPTLAVSLNITTNTLPSEDHIAPDDQLKVVGPSPLYVVFQ